ncbi:hypothetical protein Ciccas_008308 [Cichlidogyrus casuarinus]|uniref:Uncharacterized protein n=1 Tax=Cichlidogyrus casuarinus TaxID=1844966 RepID=A0ABD2Q1T4_9PLAT
MEDTMDPEVQRNVEKQLTAPLTQDSDSEEEGPEEKKIKKEEEWGETSKMVFDIVPQKRSHQLVFPVQERKLQLDEYGQRLSEELIVSLVSGGLSGPSQNEAPVPKREQEKRKKKTVNDSTSIRSKMMAILQSSDETLLNLFTQQNTCSQVRTKKCFSLFSYKKN